MNNFRPFSDTYMEVIIPLDSKMITAFEQSEQYAYLLEPLYRANDNPAYSSVGVTLTVSFDFKSMETFFSINTICRGDEGIDCEGEYNITFDDVTATYFKNEALKHLRSNFQNMMACNIGKIAISA